jgi:hypothetical protein
MAALSHPQHRHLAPPRPHQNARTTEKQARCKCPMLMLMLMLIHRVEHLLFRNSALEYPIIILDKLCDRLGPASTWNILMMVKPAMLNQVIHR